MDKKKFKEDFEEEFKKDFINWGPEIFPNLEEFTHWGPETFPNLEEFSMISDDGYSVTEQEWDDMPFFISCILKTAGAVELKIFFIFCPHPFFHLIRGYIDLSVCRELIYTYSSFIEWVRAYRSVNPSFSGKVPHLTRIRITDTMIDIDDSAKQMAWRDIYAYIQDCISGITNLEISWEKEDLLSKNHQEVYP